MKLSVIYHSESGNTAKMAARIICGMNSAEGIEAKAFSLDELDKDFARESRALVLGTPVYAASMSGKMKMWIETTLKDLQTEGKLAGAFATANYVHGGGDIAIQSILSHMLVYGMLAYSSGATSGQPVIHFGPVAIHNELEKYDDLFTIYGRRMAEKAKALF